MKLDLRNSFISDEQIKELRTFLTGTDVGRRWMDNLYVDDLSRMENNRCYVQSFVEKALKEEDIVALKSPYDDANWWKEVIQSVEYFREKLEVKQPVEALMDEEGEIATISYQFGFHPAIGWIQSEMIIGPLPVSDSVMEDLIATIGHEIWHAHQAARIAEVRQRTNDIIDLIALDPNDPENRGAIYLLSNIILYEGPGSIFYRCQIAEAEALLIQGKVKQALVSE